MKCRDAPCAVPRYFIDAVCASARPSAVSRSNTSAMTSGESCALGAAAAVAGAAGAGSRRGRRWMQRRASAARMPWPLAGASLNIGVIEPSVCATPSSVISKSFAVRPATGSPLRSRTTTSTRMALTCVGEVAVVRGAGACCAPTDSVCAASNIRRRIEPRGHRVVYAFGTSCVMPSRLPSASGYCFCSVPGSKPPTACDPERLERVSRSRRTNSARSRSASAVRPAF